jgi:hypothetical protein
MKDIVVIVGCNDNSTPGFFGVRIICTEEQFAQDKHRDAACKLVRELGGYPDFCMDQDNPGFTWISVIQIKAIEESKSLDIRPKVKEPVS